MSVLQIIGIIIRQPDVFIFILEFGAYKNLRDRLKKWNSNLYIEGIEKIIAKTETGRTARYALSTGDQSFYTNQDLAFIGLGNFSAKEVGKAIDKEQYTCAEREWKG